MKILLPIFFFLMYFFPCPAQTERGEESREPAQSHGFLVTAIVVDGDTVPFIRLREVTIYGEPAFKTKKQADLYGKLKRDVKKVYPYAVLASIKLKEYNAKLATMPIEAQRKLYMKKAEEELKEQFEDDLKKLTLTQGRILIKLIDRETGSTSYELVQELRGSVSAFMWQTLARLFSSSLKTRYDAKGEDKMIEEIILRIESGEI